ncbi:hypothetical protein CEXT_815411 [Caerostris extrusa]|uniref:Uncharacterized protein n=1 Tax=Caerostris extrusa TaxID=172846 RepID=A0AAV4TXI9_CAEEX|nr:hypothetical protein CEXT_815411 [Caerostris extrusa]
MSLFFVEHFSPRTVRQKEINAMTLATREVFIICSIIGCVGVRKCRKFSPGNVIGFNTLCKCHHGSLFLKIVGTVWIIRTDMTNGLEPEYS